MAGTTSIPLTALAPGSYDFGPAAIADSDAQAALAIDRTVTSGGTPGFDGQPATTTAQITVYQSGDQGATWFLLASALVAGGQLTRNGQPIATSRVLVPLAAGTGRLAKANVTVAGASVAVAGSLTLT